MIGKRKRQGEIAESGRTVAISDASAAPELDAQEIFRRHFEAQFEPLPEVEPPTPEDEDNDSESEDEVEDQWDGISEDEEAQDVLVVQDDTSEVMIHKMSKEELKAFMSSKPPKSTNKPSLLKDKSGIALDEDDASEAANLKKDLALQRLLSESHLLESSTNPILAGTNRHKATDLRLQALGSKTSIMKQVNMPMSHRKGITAKQNQKEETRRREARENGIILEKAKVTKKKGADSRRDRGVGGPGVGRFSGGTLTLSKKDVLDIEGPRRHSSGRGGKGGRKMASSRGKAG